MISPHFHRTGRNGWGQGHPPSGLGMQGVEMRGSSADIGQELLREQGQRPPSPKKEGKIPRGQACLELKGSPVVFQGDMGAPGVRGDKGEKVTIAFP